MYHIVSTLEIFFRLNDEHQAKLGEFPYHVVIVRSSLTFGKNQIMSFFVSLVHSYLNKQELSWKL